MNNFLHCPRMSRIPVVAIVGHTGMVGSNVYRWFSEEMKYVVFGISLDKQEADWDEINKATNYIFVCVPTPFDWDSQSIDLSILESVLSQIDDGKTVIIKSTIPIGTTERLQRSSKLKLLFNPEFLSEKTAWADFTHPDRQFVGYTKDSYKEATNVLNMLPESPMDMIVPSKEAELLKYINNLHGMVEIMESNHYYEVCQKEGLDYDRVLKCMLGSKWVGCAMGRHYRVIWHNGKRGYGGTCFPKDMNNYLQYCNENNIDASLFDAVNNMNKRILKEQGLSERGAEKITFKNPNVEA